MKVLVLAFLLFLGLSYINTEITPRFPGQQPIIIDGSGGDGTVLEQYESKQTIDLFEVTSDTLIITLQTAVPPEITETGYQINPAIVGGERDIILTALTGSAGRVLSCGVAEGEFTFATPNGATGRVVIQYDGIDSSPTLDTTTGLGGLDFTANSAAGFAFNATSDFPTDLTITVVSTGGATGTVTRSVTGVSVRDAYLIPFTEFAGVDFTSVVALEFRVEAFENVDFVLQSIVTYGNVVIQPVGNVVNGSVLPCDTDYYRLQSISGHGPEDYLKIVFDQEGEPDHPNSLGVFYIVASQYADLQTELETNTNIVDTLGELPGPNNYLYKCDSSRCEFEITCELEDATYYIAIEGNNQGVLLYSFYAYLSNVTIFEIFDRTPQAVLFDRRPNVANNTLPDHIYYYRYFAIEVPESQFSEGTYLVVNVSRAEPGVQLLLQYGGLPEFPQDTGIIGASNDLNSDGEISDNCIFQYCVDVTHQEGTPYFVHPVNTQPRIPCVAETEQQYFNDFTYQLTCNLTVDPCQFRYGTWFASVLLPVRADPFDPLDTTGYANYTITAYIVQPDITPLEKNVTIKGAVYPELTTHYSIVVPETDVVPGETHLFVQVSNVRNGVIDIWVHKDVGAPQNLAGGPEGCIPANVTCETSAACNLVVEKCHFTPGTWYIGVSVSYDSTLEEFEIIDWNRLPITYTLRATWIEDPVPVPILAGVPVFSYIGEALYDFYVIDIPPTIDTWLFVELYVKAHDKCDTGVILSVLHGDLPGGECYQRPDFYCMTGDPRGLSYTTGPPTNYFEQPVQRQSCNFMIQTCELQAGPLYLSVYGHHVDYALYGDNTFYQLPVEYTLYVDFDVALAVQSGVSYPETVFEHQYQHYYIRVDYLAEGSYLSVEACNIQHGIPQSIEVFVNYNYLAGNCPCYDHLYNATGIQDPNVVPLIPSQEPNFLPEVDSVDGCATIVVPPCAFRAGVWYIGVLGVNQDLYQYTTPIGYTLTVTVHDAPEIHPLILGQSVSGVAPQWNKTLEYANYKLAAAPIPNNDLIISLTYVQNCEYLAKHDNLRDTLVLFVNKDAPAGDDCWTYTCEANIESESYCTIVIPHCEWEGNYFISVKGDYDADFIGRFTLRTYTSEVRDVELTNGVSISDSINEFEYKHYFLDVSGDRDEYLSVFFYSNNDLDSLSVYLNVNERAGDAPCFRNIASCIDDSCCTMQIEGYLLTQGRYYVSVYGGDSHFYNLATEYTLTVSTLPVVTVLSDGDPLTGSVEVGEIQHYMFDLTKVHAGDFLTFEVEVGCSHGSVAAYYQFDSLAGRIPGYLHEQSCYATPEGTQWCEIRIPSCELVVGKYFFSIRGLEYTASSPPVFQTAIGYTVELNIISSPIVVPVVEVGRFPVNTEYGQQINNERYIHYEFTVEQIEDEHDTGYHWIVEVTNVEEGSLRVFYQPGAPADVDTACHLAEICTSGLSHGRDCYWQIPYSTTRYANETLHYISVLGITGRTAASFDILIWKQPVPSIIENPVFTLDNKNSSAQFPFGAEVNITHYIAHEPNNWVQFIKLTDVPAHSDPGHLLEVFFYRIINNIGDPMSFNVYLYPRVPAGAHGCCDEDPGSCQEQPTQRTVDLTTETILQPETQHFLCELPDGVGRDASGLQPFFGQRCTVRVWPCEFSRFCNNETLDWWLAVVPVAPSSNAGVLPGLSYSVQWRTHNIRLDGNLDVGTTSLDQYVNSYDYTPEFTVYSTSTEDEGWRSFVVTAPSVSSRLSIQTNFINGSSIVYIRGENFASAPTHEVCSDYWCASGSDCAGSGRFISSLCEYGQYSKYYITVRNVGGRDAYNIVSFRIVAIEEPSVLTIPQYPTEAVPYVGTSGFSSLLNTTGVEGENYNFYVLSIDDNDLNEHQSLIIDLQMYDDDSDGELELYVRLGAKAGNYLGENDSFYSEPEACFTYQYTCAINASPDSDRCTLQIPHTQLVQGHYYITVFNPNFDFGPGPSLSLPDYNLTVFFQVPTELSLNTTYSFVNESQSLLYPGTYTHFFINITQTDITYDPRTDLQGYYTSWLRFQLDGGSPDDALYFYMNYDNLAGSPDSVQYSLAYIDAQDCTSTGCFIDVLPCDEWDLKTGVYFVSLYLRSETTYNLTVNVFYDLYDSLTSETIQGVGNREGTTNLLWRHESTQAELEANGDGYGIYRYVVDTNAGEEDDDVIDSNYFYVNVTTDGNADGGDVYLKVWRDDCNVFDCNTASYGQHWCVIDALTLAPCSIKGGRFYFAVENPSAVNFTLSFYKNETTIQTLLDQQVITEIVYPYEYQEYFYEAVDVSQGATLTVHICSICGSVEAWIRPDLPAGPGPDGSMYPTSCGLDHCIIDDTTESFGETQCCTLFLDTCQYEQRGYYIAVRGVSTNFPSVANPHLYLPAKYQIQAYQTNVQVLDAPFVCPQYVEYLQRPSQVPRQFAFDLESLNVGASLRFSMALPYQYVPAPGSFAVLSVALNRTVGYTTECENLPYSCTVSSDDSYYGCSFIVPACAIKQGRYYVWADAPRGTEVIVERWDPVIPLIQDNVYYHASINAPSPTIEFPFSPATQYYRLDYGVDDDDAGDDDTSKFYNKFFVRVRVQDVQHGSISASVNTGYYPISGEYGDNCPTPVFLDTYSCAIATDGFDCRIDIQRTNINFYEDDESDDVKEYSLQRTFWLVINGLEQECELHSIQYSFVVQTNWELTYFPLDHTIVNRVQEDEFNFHRLRPHECESPQQSYLHVELFDIDVVDGEEVQFYLKDNYIPTPDDYDFTVRSSRAQSPDVREGSISFDWLCSYENMYFSIYGINSADGFVDYAMNVTKVHVPVKELFNNDVYAADDDDDDMCPHEHDFYIFRAVAPNGGRHASFLRVAVESDFPVEVYVNRGSFAWKQCHVAHGATTSGGTLNLYDFCGYTDGIYYITVISNGPYYIYTNVVDEAKELTLGHVHRDYLEPGQYQLYTLEVCKDWFAADDRLVIEIADVENGDVFGWIQRDSNPGPFQSPQGDGVCDIPNTSSHSIYAPAESGYDFILLDHAILEAGTYHILVRAAPSNDDYDDVDYDDDEDRNPLFVQFRIFPYLEDLEIDPIELRHDTVVTAAVDYYTIDRATVGSNPFIQYYVVQPSISGYENGITFGQALLSDVEGGRLNLRVMGGHLATPLRAYIPGDIIALTQDYVLPNNMQSGRYPYTYQYIMDQRNSKYQHDCDGSTDWCGLMTGFDPNSNYETDSSISVWVPSCYFDLAFPTYIAVEASYQDYKDHPISYSLEFKQYVDYVLLQPNKHVERNMTHWEHHFFRSLQSEVQSARWRVVVTQGEGVLVTVRNHRCPLQASWTREIWCDADYFDRPWMCDIEIPTAASHPGNNVFFVDVYGQNATYSISYLRGLQNCHAFDGAGRSDGLDFCAGLVPYNTWRWDDYTKLDNEAECFFEELYNHFRVQPCWSGVTTDCNATLQRFACYESFRACDAQGFYVGTCRSACNAVVYECVNWFESVNLEHYNCTSSRYIDEESYYCTGATFPSFNSAGTQNFFGNPDDILYLNENQFFLAQPDV